MFVAFVYLSGGLTVKTEYFLSGEFRRNTELWKRSSPIFDYYLFKTHLRKYLMKIFIEWISVSSSLFDFEVMEGKVGVALQDLQGIKAVNAPILSIAIICENFGNTFGQKCWDLFAILKKMLIIAHLSHGEFKIWKFVAYFMMQWNGWKLNRRSQN